MKLFDGTLHSPAENLAFDEALLDACEDAGEEVLRLWESPEHFVVVGYANKVGSEVNTEACRKRNISILRRCTGGGTVVQGPGCLNYAVTLRIATNEPLSTVQGTNRFVMERNRQAMQELLGVPVSIQGHTDLAIEVEGMSCLMKFSGNSQRRKRDAVLFHGTVLYNFDVALISELLRHPTKEPAYRKGRAHDAFVGNVRASAGQLREALRSAWRAKELAPRVEITPPLQQKYNQASWNLAR